MRLIIVPQSWDGGSGLFYERRWGHVGFVQTLGTAERASPSRRSRARSSPQPQRALRLPKQEEQKKQPPKTQISQRLFFRSALRTLRRSALPESSKARAPVTDCKADVDASALHTGIALSHHNNSASPQKAQDGPALLLGCYKKSRSCAADVTY